MKNRVIGTAALVLVLLSLLAVVCLFAFQDGIRRFNWIDLESAARGALGICLVGWALGWMALKTGEGKATLIVGALLLVFFAYQFLRSSSPPPSAPIHAVTQPGP